MDCEPFTSLPLRGCIWNILLPSCHNLDPECLTALLSNGGSETSYFPPVREWIWNALLPTNAPIYSVKSDVSWTKVFNFFLFGSIVRMYTDLIDVTKLMSSRKRLFLDNHWLNEFVIFFRSMLILSIGKEGFTHPHCVQFEFPRLYMDVNSVKNTNKSLWRGINSLWNLYMLEPPIKIN